MEIGIEQAKVWITKANQRIQENKQLLTELDQAIGDGDHGFNMTRGFQEVINKMDQSNYKDLGSLFQEIGMTLLTKVGGASGPLYGTAFMKAAVVLKGKQTIDVKGLGEAFVESVHGMKLRGKAELGDKTMIDVWEPVTAYLIDNSKNLDWEKFITFSREKMESTKEMEAKRGRAAYLGKRSMGHIDAGSASSHYIFEALGKVFTDREVQS